MKLDASIYNGEPQPSSDLVAVIDRTARIEEWMTRIIFAYCSPRLEARTFMWSMVLDTSVMSTGAKAKVVMAIALEMNFDLEKNAIHKVIELRNAFAHHATDANFTIGTDNEGETIFYSEFRILRASGKLDKKKRHEAFEEFNHAYFIAKASLIELTKLTAPFVS